MFDFDGTLAHRPGMWTQCLLDVLDTHHSGHGVGFDDLRPHLRDGFPWHRSEVPHPELADADTWWDALGPLFERTYQAVGIEPALARHLRPAIRSH